MKLERPHRLACLLVLCLAWYVWQGRNTPAPAPGAASVKARAPQPSAPDGPDAEPSGPEREALARMEAEKEKRDLAASKSLDARASLQAACQNSWLEVLTTNQQAFLALREKAKRSPTEETPCTLCDGKGYMHFCLICRNRGICETCRGAGRNGFGEPCSVCLGTRKCFYCFGSGKMLCPFCDDGMITARGPLPPRTMPVR
jgi:hypothetical protein